MKRLEYILLGCLLVFGGCAQTSQLDPSRPELVQISSLPSFASFVQKDRLTFNVLFCVLPDGKVADVRILGTSGNPKWDEAAMDSMRHWRFAHVVGNCPPEGMWVRNAIVVQPEEQTVMTLGELKATGEREADSLYSLLRKEYPSNLSQGFQAQATRLQQILHNIRAESGNNCES